MNKNNTAIYCACMEEIRKRLGLIESIASETITTDDAGFNIEFIFLQMRKILELIAFASLTSNKEIYSEAYDNFSSHWRVKAIISSLEKINPDFYPTPLEPPIRQADGCLHFPKPENGFMTKEEFIQLYEASSQIIHVRNPFSTKDPLETDYNIEQWVRRIRKLLTWHVMHLVEGDKWLVEFQEKGLVHVYPASPIPDIKPPE